MNSAEIRSILPQILLAFFVIFLLLQIPQSAATQRSFQVDRKNNVFLKDGRPFRYISGEIHYFRIHPSLWQDRLHRVRAMGLNAVQVYIPWNYHEAKPGNFNFGGDRDVAQFLRLAQQNELDVLLRIGPYVCAELEFGGMPWWLVKDQANIQLRVHNENYLQYVERYFNVLLRVLQPLLYKNGGPILMIQIENEYGSVLCDHAYTKWLRDLVRARLGQDVVLYTTDGPTEWMTTCGAVEDTFTTVDFGPPQTEDSIKNHFAIQRKHSGGGPNVNSEFYTMWFSMWGDAGLFRQQIEPVMNALELMWKQNASFSLYMVHGGTNFGFWNGRETNGPVITSYDYAAPISEEGQVTPLFEAIRNWISTKANWPNPPLPIPSNRTGVSINNVMAVRLNNFIKILNSTTFGQSHQCLSSSGKPLNFEQFDRDHAFVWYSTTLDKGGKILQIPDLHDHGYVFLDGKFMGNLSICDKTGCVKNVTLLGRLGQRLDILVESAGRLTYPLTKVDPKGILSNVLLDGKPIGQKWLQCGVDFEVFNSMALQGHSDLLESMENEGFDEVLNEPAIYVAKFNTHGVDWTQMHTFFDSRGWGHGVAIVNGFNIGRYWPLLGPQTSLFVPGAVMKNENFVVLLELTGRQKADSNIQFVAEPVLKFGEDLFPTANPSIIDDVDDIQTRDTTEISGYKRRYEMAWALHSRRLLRQRNSFAAKANNRRRHSSLMGAFQQNEKKFMNFLSHF